MIPAVSRRRFAVSGNKFLLDTNIVLYLLGGKLTDQDIPSGSYSISVVTELELLSYPTMSTREEAQIRKFLDQISIVGLTREIKANTIALRKSYKLKLPDAIICSAALCTGAILVTADKSLKRVKEISIEIPPIT